MATKYIHNDLNIDGTITATTLVKSGGTDSQYLMADGSIKTAPASSGEIATLDQSVAAATWTFNHNLDNLFPVVMVYDSTDKQILPDEIEAISATQCVIRFGSATAGTAVAMVGGTATPGANTAYTNANNNFSVGQTITGSVTATSFIKSGGTNTQFLKADGSIDSSTYSTSGHVHAWSDITSGTPTTLAGYGISDSKANFNTALSDGSFMFVGDAPTSHNHAIADLTDFSITGAAKGDILVHNGTDFIDVTIGTNDFVLVADSAETSGVKWASNTPADNSVGITQLAAELKTVVALGAGTAVNWSSGIQFEKTMTTNTTLTFSNVVEGKTITLVIDGNYTLTLPTGVDTGDLTDFDGTKTNVIHIYCHDSTTPKFSTSLRAY